jgi:N utilization substance protein B
MSVDPDCPADPEAGAPPAQRRAGGSARSARRRAREFALLRTSPGYELADEAYFLELLQGTIDAAPALRAQFSGAIDRPLAQLSPVEHSILLIATYELAHRPEIPFRVVINEAVELAKSFGASDGFRYVNGVLDKLAGPMRGAETARTPTHP